MSSTRSTRRAAVRWAAPALGLTVFLLGACGSEQQEKPPNQASAMQTGGTQGCPCGGGCDQEGGCDMGKGPGMGMGHGRGGGPMCTMETGPLTDPVKEAVFRALEDEWKAEATYNGVLTQLGSVLPFARISRAEQHHSGALQRLLTSHGVAIPERKPAAPSPKYQDLAAACAVGIAAEKSNVALYDDLAKTPLPDDVKCVFSHLRMASQEHHLPALQACATPQ